MGNTASRAVPISNGATPTESEDTPAAATGVLAQPTSTFGNNRLSTGFTYPPPSAAVPAPAGSNHNEGEYPRAASRKEAQAVIEISDDDEDEEGEVSDDDGGMLINVDGPRSDDLPVEMDLDEDEHESENRIIPREEVMVTRPRSSKDDLQTLTASRNQAHTQLQADLDHHLNSLPTANPLPPKPTPEKNTIETTITPVPRLMDLSSDELQLQLKYAFFDVGPTRVDLSQPAVCLSCLRIGHVERVCPEVTCLHCSEKHSSRLCSSNQRCTKCRERGHRADSCPTVMKVTTVPCDICGNLTHVEQSCPRRFFQANPHPITEPQKLWISCCRCASKTHLVGDCPQANQLTTSRWSLKAFAPGSVTNLNAGPDMARMEEVAANRGLRPEGLRIRGRAGLHRAGVPNQTHASNDNRDGDDEEQFLRPRISNPDDRVAGRTSVNTQTQKPIEPKRPSKQLLAIFVNALNKMRQSEGKNNLKFEYRR